MRLLNCSILIFLAALAAAPLTSCKKKEAVRKSGSSKERTPVETVTVETRADGLAYLPGSDQPFTGDAITPFPEAPWLVKMREPYVDGKRNGDKVELFKKGTVKTSRTYDHGVPKAAVSYHYNGQKRFEVILNAADKAEGPYIRWYANGVVEGTSGLDENERWHGEFKEFTREGELKTHHIFEHGLLKKIIFETEESKATRLAAGLELQPAAEAPAPPPIKPTASDAAPSVQAE